MEEDSELKPMAHVNVVQDQVEHGFDNILNWYSSWYRLQRAVVWFMRYKEYCIARYLDNKSREELMKCKREITISELATATQCIVKYVQKNTYPNRCSPAAHEEDDEDSQLAQRYKPIPRRWSSEGWRTY